jgi:hypothetical protein
MSTPYGLVSQKRTFSYSAGWQAEQVFCLPFAGEFSIAGGTNVDGVYAGVDDFIASNSLVFYPGSDLLQVTQIQDEPWMDEDVVYEAGMSVSRKVTFTYAIVYLDVPWPSNIIQPGYLAGSTLKLKTKYAGQYMTIPPAAIDAGAGPAADPQTQATQFIALNEYEVEWDRVQNLDDLDFSELIGCVNSDTFMGSVAGTILCEGAPQENTTVLSPSNPLAWKTTVSLKQRQIFVSGAPRVYGWNDWYNTKTQQWEALTLTNGHPPYNSTAFAGMFS